MIPGSAQQFSISSAAFFHYTDFVAPAFLLRITERYVTLRYTFFLQMHFLHGAFLPAHYGALRYVTLLDCNTTKVRFFLGIFARNRIEKQI